MQQVTCISDGQYGGYLLKQNARTKGAYYADPALTESVGRITAAGGWAVTEGGTVSKEDLDKMLDFIDPVTGEKYGRDYKVKEGRKKVMAYDCTFSVPKSVSVVWALAPDESRKKIEAAIAKGNLAYVNALQASVSSRKGKGCKQFAPVSGGAMVATFMHWTSRAGDPHPHGHNLFSNKVLCDDGVWRAQDGTALHHASPFAGMKGEGVLRVAMTQELGFDWTARNAKNSYDVAGVDEDVMDLFSKRSHQIKDKTGEYEVEFFAAHGRKPTEKEVRRLRDKAALVTRERKSTSDEPEDQHQDWRDEAAAAGIGSAEVWESAIYGEREEPGGWDRRPETWVGVDGLGEGYVWESLDWLSRLGGMTDNQLKKEIAASISVHPDVYRIDELRNADPEQLWDAKFNEAYEAINLELEHKNGLWWAPPTIEDEKRCVAIGLGQQQNPRPVSRPVNVDGLSDGQAEAAELVANCTDRVFLIVGPAGAGKTTALKPAVESLGHDQVVAIAPTAVAATNLGDSIGVEGRTLARLLISDDPLPHGCTFILDEAGQVSTKDTRRLLEKVEAVDGRLAMVGDHRQQPSIEAGGMFEASLNIPDIKRVELTDLYRFKDPEENEATLLLRDGNLAGLLYHRNRGRLKNIEAGDVIEHALEWWEPRRDRTTAITVSDNETRKDINAAIAARKHELGETSDIIGLETRDEIRVGDTIASRRNNHRLKDSGGKQVKNGDLWVVTGDNTAHRLGEPTNTITFPDSYAEHIELGYAITHSRAQSLTVDAALTLVNDRTSRSRLYVGATRGRDENHIYVATDYGQHPADIAEGILKREDQWKNYHSPDEFRELAYHSQQQQQAVDSSVTVPQHRGLELD